MLGQKKNLVWIGISMQKGANQAFDEGFLSGKIVSRAMAALPEFTHHKANLVDFAPLDENNRIRYPTTKEIILNQRKLLRRLEEIDPMAIIAMGGMVTRHLGEMLRIKSESPKSFNYRAVDGKWPLVSVHHPSYVGVYKKKEMQNYIIQITDAVNGVLRRKK